ncbi:transcriptional regulator GcvA [Maricurvus nonylphenolicus]|uniref:LysR substrate-binding domain-containing protein n=1 Tax=Maricurvus nonylphenolicus TaxID=1008307 RepID=UPI0036F2F72A
MLLDRRNLPLNAMRAFEVVARHCHLRQAAEELGVTHGAVSRQVRQLEDQLGVSLFDRSHNRLALTSAGQRLLISVKQALDLLSESALYLDPDSMQGNLMIASTPSIASGWLLPVIGSFGQRYPEIEVHLINIAPQQRSISADIDVALCYGEPEANNRHLETLFQERYFPVCSPQLLSSGDVPALEELLSYPLLYDRHNLWARWFDAAKMVATPKQRIYLQDSYQVISAAREGYGIALADRIDISRDLNSGQLIALSTISINAEQQHYLLTDDESHINVRARLFVEHLKDHIAQ